jgi:hypothetical protein
MEDKYDPLVYEILKAKFDLDWNRIDTLDQKANNTIGFVGIILSLLLALGDWFLKEKENNLNYNYGYVFFVFVVLLFIVSIFYALKATSIKNYKTYPGMIRDFIDEVEKQDKQFIIESAILNYGKAIEINIDIINKKAEYIKSSHHLFVIGLFINALFVIYLILIK